MGLLGLMQLVWFSEQHTAHARLILTHSTHARHGFPFACVGINMTSLCVSLLSDHALKRHLWNVHSRLPKLADLHDVYAAIFTRFDVSWLAARPESVMEFNHHRRMLESRVREVLASPHARLDIVHCI